MKSSTTAREIIVGLFIGLTVACWGLFFAGPLVFGWSVFTGFLWLGVWLLGSLFLALVKVIVF